MVPDLMLIHSVEHRAVAHMVHLEFAIFPDWELEYLGNLLMFLNATIIALRTSTTSLRLVRREGLIPNDS